MKLQPIATALFANSPFTEGRPNGLGSWRCDVWCDVDNQRSGLLPFVFEDSFTYRDYAEWALDVPMYFVTRDGRYTDATDVTFRQFMDGALKGRIPDPEPQLGDWTNHLSTLFPDVRLKTFLEMRGADGGPWRRICALPAYWVGLLYDAETLAAAESADQGLDLRGGLRHARSGAARRIPHAVPRLHGAGTGPRDGQLATQGADRAQPAQRGRQ